MIKKALLIISFLIFLPSIIFAKNLQNITAEQFVAANPTLERKAIVDFIVKQFDAKRKKRISQAELELQWKNLEFRKNMRLTRFQIVNQKLYADSFDVNDYYFKPLLEYINKIIKKYKILDIDFIVYARDEIPEKNGLEKETLNIPAFMMSKNINSIYEKDQLLLVDAFMLQKKWKDLVSQIEKANSLNTWTSKKEKIFWRGGPHGSESKYLYNITNFDKLARLKLVMFSKLYPDLIDARFTGGYGEFSQDKDGDNLREVFELLSVKINDRVSEVDHLKYKYLVTIDGNTCPWVRVPWIMLSNSVLVKQETSNIEWFYSALKPYVNYVPIKKDLTDIFDKIEWLKTHDKEAQAISMNAQNFIKNELMPEHIEAHMAIILNEYATIQKDKEIIPTLFTVEEIEQQQKSLKEKEQEDNYKNLNLSKKIRYHWKALKNKLQNLAN